MKKENLKRGIKCRVKGLLTDHNGALYKDDKVTIIEWSNVTTKDLDDGFVIYVEDELGKHHTVGLKDLEVL